MPLPGSRTSDAPESGSFVAALFTHVELRELREAAEGGRKPGTGEFTGARGSTVQGPGNRVLGHRRGVNWGVQEWPTGRPMTKLHRGLETEVWVESS